MQWAAWREKSAANASQHGLAGVLLRLWADRRAAKAGDSRQMELLETLSLGGRRQLMLIRCGDERFLVGGSLDGIETMVKLGTGNPGTARRDGLCE